MVSELQTAFAPSLSGVEKGLSGKSGMRLDRKGKNGFNVFRFIEQIFVLRG